MSKSSIVTYKGITVLAALAETPSSNVDCKIFPPRISVSLIPSALITTPFSMLSSLIFPFSSITSRTVPVPKPSLARTASITVWIETIPSLINGFPPKPMYAYLDLTIVFTMDSAEAVSPLSSFPGTTRRTN